MDDLSSNSFLSVVEPSSGIDTPSSLKGKFPFFSSNQPERDRPKSRSLSGSRIRDPASPPFLGSEFSMVNTEWRVPGTYGR